MNNDEKLKQLDEDIALIDKELEDLKIQMNNNVEIDKKELEKQEEIKRLDTIFQDLNKRVENYNKGIIMGGSLFRYNKIIKDFNKLSKKEGLENNLIFKEYEKNFNLKLIDKRVFELNKDYSDLKFWNTGGIGVAKFLAKAPITIPLDVVMLFTYPDNSLTFAPFREMKLIEEELAKLKDNKEIFLKEIEEIKELQNLDEKIIDKLELKETNLELEKSNKELDSTIDDFINQVKIEDTNKKVDIKINDYVESVKKAQSYDDFLKSKENGTYVPYVEPVKEKKIDQPFQSYDDYLKKNQEKIDKLDNQNTQIVKKYVEVVKLDVPKESVEEQIQFNKEKEKVANLMLESFKINYMAEKGLKEIRNHNDFLNFMEDKFITKISNLDDEDLKYKVYNDFENLKDKYIKDNKVDRQHNGSSTSKDFLDEKNKYLAAHAAQEVPDISIGDLIF